MEQVLVYAMSENIGGVEEYVLNLSRYNFEKKRKYVYIILGHNTPYINQLKSLGVEFYFITKKKKLFQNIKELDNLLRKKRSECSIIYFNTSTLCYPIPYLLALKYKYKIVLHSHLTGTNGMRKYIHLFNRIWIGKICKTKFACSKMAGQWMFNNKNVTIIPNAILLDRFKYNGDFREKIRNSLQIQDRFVIGHVGRLSDAKNQSFLLDLLYTGIKKQMPLHLLLVGDGENEAKLKIKAKQMQLEKYVTFFGRTENPEELLSAMDCFVMPSIVEGFPITLVEAQAAGLPCLIADSITNEVNLTNRIEFAKLEDSIESWLDKMMKLDMSRYDGIKILREKGYDVMDLEATVGYFIDASCEEFRI